MSRSTRIEFPGAYYHVYARGNNKQEIFRSYRDRAKFLEYIDSAAVRFSARIHCYCLMGNHYHLLLETPDGDLSKIMHLINSSYSSYYNKKWDLTGHLFQGRYQAILVEANEYALELSRYIHMNPVKSGYVKDPEDYSWSSYPAYIGKATMPEWLNTEFIKGQLGCSSDQFVKELKEFTTKAAPEQISWSNAAFSILGSKKFVKEMTNKHNQHCENNHARFWQTDARTQSLQYIDKAVRKHIPFNDRLGNRLSLFFCKEIGRASLAEIGAYFGMSTKSISISNSRLLDEISNNPNLDRLAKRIRDELQR